MFTPTRAVRPSIALIFGVPSRTDSWKALNELIQRIVVFQVLKQRLYRNPCAAENRGAPEDFRIECYQRLMSHGIILSQVLYRVNSGALVGPAIFVTKLFEQLAQILKHGVFFGRPRTISKGEPVVRRFRFTEQFSD